MVLKRRRDTYMVFRNGGGLSVRQSVHVARGFRERLRGLIGSRPASGRVLWFDRCDCVHTFGMEYPIDVAFVAGGRVLEVRRCCLPGRVWRRRGASAVVERPHSRSPWLRAGDEVELVCE